MLVFFYGLFMDESVLARKGIEPSEIAPGSVEDFTLRVGDRATLVPQSGSRAYGLVMTLAAEETEALYADDSVSDYLPESVRVELKNGNTVEATCYILPSSQIAGANKEYAAALLKLATELGFPESYLTQITKVGHASE